MTFASLPEVSACTPVVVDNTAVWYVTHNVLSAFYSLTAGALLCNDTQPGERTLTTLSALNLVTGNYYSGGRLHTAEVSALPAE